MSMTFFIIKLRIIKEVKRWVAKELKRISKLNG